MDNKELFIIDLSGCSNTGEIINNVSVALEIPNAHNKIISLRLKDNVLNQSQMLSIKSLIASQGSILGDIETSSLITQKACEGMGMKVTYTKSEIMSEPLPQAEYVQQNSVELTDIPFKQEEKIPVIEEFKMPKPEDILNLNQNPVQEAPNVQAMSLMQNSEFAQLKQEVEMEEAKGVPEVSSNEPVRLETHIIQEEPVAEGEKRTIGVYKKATDEEANGILGDYEQVDFYAPPTDEPVVIDSKQTIYVSQTLRSGQILEYDGNIVIIGDCHPGSEVKATGDITVWGVLGSIAHAGSKGNRDAKIRALKMNAVQLRIANCYSRRPDAGNIPYIVKSAVFTPEEARIIDDGIVLFKLG